MCIPLPLVNVVYVSGVELGHDLLQGVSQIRLEAVELQLDSFREIRIHLSVKNEEGRENDG